MINKLVETLEAVVKGNPALAPDIQPVIDEARQYLQDTFIDVWHIDDVMECASNMNTTINREEAGEVLRAVEDNFDANNGVSFYTIECEIENYKGEHT